ncbi:uncharacterized, partial [Tachysurus ichikawai]
MTEDWIKGDGGSLCV